MTTDKQQLLADLIVRGLTVGKHEAKGSRGDNAKNQINAQHIQVHLPVIQHRKIQIPIEIDDEAFTIVIVKS